MTPGPLMPRQRGPCRSSFSQMGSPALRTLSSLFHGTLVRKGTPALAVGSVNATVAQKIKTAPPWIFDQGGLFAPVIIRLVVI